MAAFAASQIEREDSMFLPSPHTPKVVYARIKCDLDTQGGDGSNKISAAALGFKKLLLVGNVFDSNGAKLYMAGIDATGDNLLIADDLTDGDVADVAITGAYINILGI